MARKHLSHIKSKLTENGGPKLPTPSQLIEGEIAVNFAKGYETLSILNSNSGITTFSNDTTIMSYVDGQDMEIANAAGISAVTTSQGLTDYQYVATPNNPILSGATSLKNADELLSQTILDNEIVIARALNDINDRKLDASAYTPTDLSNYYNKQEIDTALSSKQDTNVYVNLSATVSYDFINASLNFNITSADTTPEEAYAEYLEDKLITARINVTGLFRTIVEMQARVIYGLLRFTGIADIGSPFGVCELEVTGFPSDVENNEVGGWLAAVTPLQKKLTAGNGITISNDNVISCNVDSDLNSGSSNPVANSAITLTILENERIVSSALTELHDNKLDISAYTPYDDSQVRYLIATKQDKLTAGTGIDITDNVISCSLEMTKFVSELPLTGETGKIYFVPNAESEEQGNVFTEYAWTTGNTWEKIGEWKADITIDQELDSGSTNPVANSAITEALNSMAQEFVIECSGDTLTDVQEGASTLTITNGVTAQDVVDAYNQGKNIVVDAYFVLQNIAPLSLVANIDSILASGNDFMGMGEATVTLREMIWSSPVDSVRFAVTTEQSQLDVVAFMVLSPLISYDTIHNEASLIMLSEGTDGLTGNFSPKFRYSTNLDSTLSPAVAYLDDLYVETTYSELKDLRDGGELTPGTWYRITDYQCATTQANTSAATHPFDILVLATYTDKLSEEARAVNHNGDTYFANSNLNAWKVWYCLDNDKYRFAWADYSVDESIPASITINGVKYNRNPQEDKLAGIHPYAWKADTAGKVFTNEERPSGYPSHAYNNSTGGKGTKSYTIGFYTPAHEGTNLPNGRGVIYRMIDEWNNDCPYDFKNILFKRPLTDGQYDTGGTDTWCYTFNAWYQSSCADASIVGNIIVGGDDFVFGVYDNKFGHLVSTDVGTTLIFKLPDNVFATTVIDNVEYDGCHSNTFGDDCEKNTFGNNCFDNVFGYGCNENVLGNHCYHNRLEDSCYRNILGDYSFDNVLGAGCRQNTFDTECSNNTLYNDCRLNAFGPECNRNRIGHGCSSNSFKYQCNGNILENNCTSNGFEDMCDYNTLCSSCVSNTFGESCMYNSLGNGCSTNTFGVGFVNCRLGNNVNHITFSKNYGSSIIIENGNQYITITSTQTPTSGNNLRNITIAQGVNNTSTTKTISHNTLNDTFHTTYQPANSQVISV